MNSERIKEIQETTAYPNSVSVKQALLQVWNECEQEKNVQSKGKTKEDLKQLFATECTELNASGRLEVKGTPMEIFEWFWNQMQSHANKDGWVSVEVVGGYEETLKAALKGAVDEQHQQNREEFHAGREDAFNYAIEMLAKHGLLNYSNTKQDRERLYTKFKNGEDRYFNDNMFHAVIRALEAGKAPLHVIDDLLASLDDVTFRYKTYMEQNPPRSFTIPFPPKPQI